MPKLENVVLEVQQNKGTVSLVSKRSLQSAVAVVAVLASVGANAATVMPDIDVADLLIYIGLLVAAVATVASANLMITLAAKGIKALKQAF